MEGKTILFKVKLVNVLSSLIVQTKYSTTQGSTSNVKINHVSAGRTDEANALNTAKFLLLII
jgi:acyl-coenzyme A thioesterase PaaI-like protein